MRKSHYVSGAAICALAILLAGSTRPDSASASGPTRCSLVLVPTGRSVDETYFIATARSDTVLAGPGTLRPTGLDGHGSRGTPRAVYGQLVRIDTLAGGHVDRIRTALGGLHGRDILVVPWDYDPGCETTYWSGSARWTEPGLVSFYDARLRPDSLWVEGRPTFDVFYASTQPYPHNPSFRADFGLTTEQLSRPSLTVREMFSLYEALPVYASGSTSPDSLRDEPLRRWAAANPELAKRYPAAQVIMWVSRMKGR